MTNTLISPNGTPSSSFCFGTMQFGGGADETQSRAMYDASRAAGITFFDTAFVYADGASETLLGQFAKPERDALVIATLQQQGKIGVIGVSNFSAWQVMKAQTVAEKLGTTINILQPMYNLVKRQVEVEILPMAASEGFNVAPYSPLGGGLLTGKYTAGNTGRITTDKGYAIRYGQDWMHQTAANLTTIAARENINPATLAVVWAAMHPAVTAPIISARTPDQLQPSLDAISYKMPAELYAEITALSPTPPPATDRLDDV